MAAPQSLGRPATRPGQQQLATRRRRSRRARWCRGGLRQQIGSSAADALVIRLSIIVREGDQSPPRSGISPQAALKTPRTLTLSSNRHEADRKTA